MAANKNDGKAVDNKAEKKEKKAKVVTVALVSKTNRYFSSPGHKNKKSITSSREHRGCGPLARYHAVCEYLLKNRIDVMGFDHRLDPIAFTVDIIRGEKQTVKNYIKTCDPSYLKVFKPGKDDILEMARARQTNEYHKKLNKIALDEAMTVDVEECLAEEECDTFIAVVNQM